MATISYTLDVETSKGFKKVLDLHNQATALFNRGVTLRLNNQFSGPLGKITGDVKQFDQSLNAATARVLAFTSTTSILYSVGAAMRRLVTDAVNVEAALKGIQAVSSASDSSIKSLGASLFNVANQTGQSFYDVAAAAEEFSRQGLTVAESLKAVTAASNLARLSGTNLKDSIGGLVSVISTFSSQALEYADVVNTLASVDAQFATSAAGLVDGLKRVGGVAESAGLSLQKTTSLIASIKQLTGRSEAVIGNGLKSIITNLQTESVQKALEGIGIQTKNVNGEFRDLIDVFKEYAVVSEKLDPQRKANVEQKIAGKYQINNFQGLVKSFSGGGGQSLFDKALTAANPDEGLTQRRIELLNSTTKTAEQRLQNKITELGAGVGSELVKPAFDKTLDFISKLLSQVESFSKSAGPLFKGLADILSGPVLITAGAAILNLFIKLSKEVGGAVASILKFNTSEQEVLVIQNAINSALKNGNQQLVEQVRNATTLADRTAAINALLRDNIALGRATQGNQFLDARLVDSANRKAIVKNKAGGYIPPGFEDAFAREDAQIKAGVGGASRNARAVLKSLNLSGSSERVVVNSDEVIVRNFMGTGRDSVLNKNMLKKVGSRVQSLGQVENLAQGFNPIPVPKGNSGFYTGSDIPLKEAKELLERIKKQFSSTDNSTRFAASKIYNSFRGSIGSANPYNAQNLSSTTISQSGSGKTIGEEARAHLQAIAAKTNAEIKYRNEVKQTHRERANTVKQEKLITFETELRSRKEQAKLAGRTFGVKDVEQTVSDVTRGSGQYTRKFLNEGAAGNARLKAISAEADDFKRILDAKREKAYLKGGTLEQKDIKSAYNDFQFTGTDSEKKEYLKGVAAEARRQTIQEKGQLLKQLRENAPAKAEIELNRFITEGKSTGKLGKLRSAFGLNDVSDKDIKAESARLQAANKLNPLQRGQFQTNTEQLINAQQDRQAQRNQTRILASSFLIPGLTGAASKFYEEKYTDADGKSQSRETAASRNISNIGSGIGNGLATASLVKSIAGNSGFGKFLGKIAAPIGIGIAANSLLNTYTQNKYGNADIKNEELSRQQEKIQTSSNSVSEYFDLNNKIKEARLSGELPSKIESLVIKASKSLSSIDNPELKASVLAAKTEKEIADVQGKDYTKSSATKGGIEFNKRINVIKDAAQEKLGISDQLGGFLSSITPNFLLGDTAGYARNPLKYSKDASKNFNEDLTIDTFKDLGSNINIDALRDKKTGGVTDLYRKITSKDFGVNGLKEFAKDKNNGISESLPGINNALENIQDPLLIKAMDELKEAIKSRTKDQIAQEAQQKVDIIDTSKINGILKEFQKKSENEGLDKLKRDTKFSADVRGKSGKLDLLNADEKISEKSFDFEQFQLKLEKIAKETSEEELKLKQNTENQLVDFIKNNVPLKDQATFLKDLQDGGIEGVRPTFDARKDKYSEKQQNEFDTIIRLNRISKEGLSVSSSDAKAQEQADFDKQNELRKIKERREREKQILGFGTDNTKYNPATALGLSSSTAASAIRKSIFEDKTLENKTKFGIRLTPDDIRGRTLRQGAFSRGRIDDFKTALQSDPNLVNLPETATDDERENQKIYKAKKRGELEKLIQDSYVEQSSTDILGKVGGAYSVINQYDKGQFGGLTEKTQVANAIKTGDFESAREAIQGKADYVNSDEFLRYNSKEKQQALSESYRTIQESLNDNTKSGGLYGEKAKLEAEQAIPKQAGEDIESIKSLSKAVVDVLTALKEFNPNTGGSNKSEVTSNVTVSVEGPLSPAEESSRLQDQIKAAVVEAIKIHAQQQEGGKPAIIPPELGFVKTTNE